MNYICKPIAGLFFKPVNFFQDGSVFNWANRWVDKYKIARHRQYLVVNCKTGRPVLTCDNKMPTLLQHIYFTQPQQLQSDNYETE